MTLDDRITLLKELFKKREAIDRQIEELLSGGGSARKQKCGSVRLRRP